MEIKQVQNKNYVHIQLAGALEICQVVGVHEQVTVASINDPFENLKFNLADVIPIPLTEFWLKELDFNELPKTLSSADRKVFTRNNVTVTCEKQQDGNHAIYAQQEGEEAPTSIAYVHELQNYFAAVKNEALSLP